MGEGGLGQGGNSAVIRHYNERVILTALRRMGEASRADLARQMTLTQNAAGQIVKGLEQQRLVRSRGKRTGLRGQPATLMLLDPDGAYAIGIEIGRLSSDSVPMDFSGRVLVARQLQRPLPMSGNVVSAVTADVAALRAALPRATRRRLTGVGIAVPFNLGSWRNELDIPADVRAAWNDFDLAGRLRAALDIPVFIENDGTAIAVAELFSGLGRELDDFVSLFVWAALAGRLVLNGAYRSGATGNASDVGLMVVPLSRLSTVPRPSRGGNDILLNRASLTALLRHLGLPRTTIGEQLDAALALRPGPLAEWLEDCADALAGPLLAMGSLLDVQAVVLDGDLSPAVLQRLLGRLRILFAERAPEARTPPALRLGTVGRHAPAIGAATLPLHLGYGADREHLFGPWGDNAS